MSGGILGPSRGPAKRWWRVAEADAFLPALDRLFDSFEAAVAGHGRHPGRGGDPRILAHGVVGVLVEHGVVVRDLGQRLVDFPARAADGREVLLCRIGTEPRIGWWHEPSSGFAGRRSLDDPPW